MTEQMGTFKLPEPFYLFTFEGESSLALSFDARPRPLNLVISLRRGIHLEQCLQAPFEVLCPAGWKLVSGQG